MVAAKSKKKSVIDRPVKYPKRLKSVVGELITVAKMKELMGWREETEVDKFGTEFLFEIGKRKIRCDNNVTNRPLYMANVDTLKRDVLNKHWKYNAEPIIIGVTGLVLNGQHTLIAGILAEEERTGPDKHHWAELWKGPITLDKDITYGVEEDDATVNTMDTCKPRTLMDVLYRSEYFKDLPAGERKAVARACSFAIQLLWQRAGGAAGGFVGKDKGKHTHAEYLDFLERHPKLLDAVRHIHQENASNAIGKYLTVGYSSAIMYLMAASDTDGEDYHLSPVKSERLINFDKWEMAHAFWVNLASGAELFKAVRYALGALDDETSGAMASKDEKIAVLALAWNQFREDVTPTEAGCKLEKSEPDPDGISHVLSWPDFGGIDRGQEPPKADKEDDDVTDQEPGEAEEEAEAAKPKAKVNQGPDPEALRTQLAKLKEKHPGRMLFIRNPEAWVLWEQDAETYHDATGKKYVERNGLKHANFKPEEFEAVARKMVEYGEKVAMCYPAGKDFTVQDYEPTGTPVVVTSSPISDKAAKVKPGSKPGFPVTPTPTAPAGTKAFEEQWKQGNKVKVKPGDKK